ncbi:hypothetical protein [Devosia epidermidihirudinis]|uniref:hypothetical protein n=1 Tax=Devosia epidermidihirudinis TaxID=1293439 RepID=UPI000617415B|nr:hypothetical protein [Devosia epidermidihirudinis]
MSSLLHTYTDGPTTAPTWLVLHPRLSDLDQARTIGASLLPALTRRIAVQSGRTQTYGGAGLPLGYFWYVGPEHNPELSTLGDGLFQLEQLLLERSGHGKVGLLGVGEGGTMALLLALTWPDRVHALAVMDAAWPENLDRMPIAARDLAALPTYLGGASAQTQYPDLFASRGATVATGDAAGLRAWLETQTTSIEGHTHAEP